MQFTKSESQYIIRLEKDEEIIKELTTFCKKENISNGYFYGLGSMLSAELGYYHLDKKAYSYKKFSDVHEIVNLTGNVILVNNKPFIHAHCALSNSNFNCFGGHLKEGIVGATCEIFLVKNPTKIKRLFDEKIGLMLMSCKN